MVSLGCVSLASALEPGWIIFSNAYSLTVFNGLDGLLVGTNGFQLVGAAEENQFGFSVATAGDMNADGRDDVVIGAPFYDETGGRYRAGRAYVLYGDSQFILSEQIVILNGSNGFQAVGGAADDRKGTAVCGIGDFNGDGYDDILIGAPFADHGTETNAGAAYLLLGHTNQTLSFDVGSLDGTNGFLIEGLASGDNCGNAVAGAGDVNGDGLDDFLLGAEGAGSATGQVYVVFGATNAVSPISLAALNGDNGFVITGESASDNAGHALAGGGDFNGDGLDDIFIGAQAAVDGWQRGRAYVVFGATNWNADFSLAALDGTNGTRLDGTNLFGQVGSAVAHADVNGDGRTDLLASAPNLNQVYALYGATRPPVAVSVTSLNGTNGFLFAVTNATVSLGASLAGAPNVNADGFEDFICGAPALSPGGISSAGGAFVVMGRPDFPAQWTSDEIDGTNGFVFEGIQALAEAGRAVGTFGDMNGDGFTDLAVGEYNYDYAIPGTNTILTNAGCVYAISPPGIPNLILYQPELLDITHTGTTDYISWHGQADVTYFIYTNTALNANAWGLAGTIVSTNATSVWSRAASTDGILFYRLDVAPR